ncbi:hypothetical protein SRHO_G00319550 [Serrasalmus rhombeus]
MLHWLQEKARSSRRTDGPPELGAAGCGFWVRGERRSLSLEPGDFHTKPACSGPPADFYKHPACKEEKNVGHVNEMFMMTDLTFEPCGRKSNQAET